MYKITYFEIKRKYKDCFKNINGMNKKAKKQWKIFVRHRNFTNFFKSCVNPVIIN